MFFSVALMAGCAIPIEIILQCVLKLLTMQPCCLI